MEKEQSSLNTLFDNVEDFQRQLSVMSERILYRKNILNNYVFLHYRRQKWKNAFKAMKDYCLNKRFRARCLRVANKSFRKESLRRIINAWRNVKYDSIVDGYCRTFTSRSDIEVQELMKSSFLYVKKSSSENDH